MSVIHTDETGVTITVTLVDQDGTALDVSGTDSKKIILVSPAGVATRYDASFTDDGSDGMIYYELTDGDVDSAGTWTMQAKVTWSGGAEYYSETTTFDVKDPMA